MIMNCKHLKFKTVSKRENLYKCRKCFKLFTDFVLVGSTSFKEIEIIKPISVIKKIGLLERILLYIKNLFVN